VLLTTMLALAGAGAGCAGHPSKASPPGRHAAPSRAADCTDLPLLDGDPGIVLGTDWSGEHHDFGDTGIVFACVTASLGGRVSLVADGTGIRIRPQSDRVDLSGSGVAAFRVTVSDDEGGRLRVQQDSDAGGGDVAGPLVVVDADGWHFAPHD
jgi:hypothetical protein